VPSRHLLLTYDARDAATPKMRKVQKTIKQTGVAAKNASVDFTKFNRTMFATTAFIGLFTISARRLAGAMMTAASMDRVVIQFKRLAGKEGIGALFQALSQYSVGIDRMEALRTGIALSSLGIMKDTSRIAEFVARAGTAAKMAGLDAAEGIRRFTKFMKDGSVAHLEFLNLIRSTNPELLIQLAALRKYGDIAGAALSGTQRLMIGQKLLIAATKGQLKGNRDLLDTLVNLGQAFKWFGKDITMFLGEALSPLLEGIHKIIFSWSGFLDKTRESHKEILFLIKSFTIATTAAAGFVAVSGLLRLSALALGSLGIGIPVLTGTVGALGLAFLGTTHNVSGFMKKLQVFGGIFKGAWELASSFLTVPELYTEGMGEMSKSTHKLLTDYGLLDLTKNLARVLIVIRSFGRGLYQGFISTLKIVKDMVSWTASLFSSLFGFNVGKWSRNWITGIEGVGKALGVLAGLATAVFVAPKLYKLGMGLLSKIPGIGRLFGGMGGAAIGGGFLSRGSVSNPMWVRLISPLPGMTPKGISLILPITAAVAIGTAIGLVIEKYFGKMINKWLGLDKEPGPTLPEKVLSSKFHLPVVQTLQKLGKKAPWKTETAALVREFTERVDPYFKTSEKAMGFYKRFLAAKSAGERVEIGPSGRLVGRGMGYGIPFGEALEKLPTVEATAKLKPLAPTPIGMPEYPKELGQEQIKIRLQEEIKKLTVDQQTIATEAFKRAIDKSSLGQENLTKAEWEGMFKQILETVMEPVIKATQQTAGNTTKSEATSVPKRHGIC